MEGLVVLSLNYYKIKNNKNHFVFVFDSLYATQLKISKDKLTAKLRIATIVDDESYVYIIFN